MTGIASDTQKTLLQHITGPRGGLFALGMFFGAGCMYLFMQQTVSKQYEAHTAAIIKQYEAQIHSLEKRVETLELRELRRIQAPIE